MVLKTSHLQALSAKHAHFLYQMLRHIQSITDHFNSLIGTPYVLKIPKEGDNSTGRNIIL